MLPAALWLILFQGGAAAQPAAQPAPQPAPAVSTATAVSSSTVVGASSTTAPGAPEAGVSTQAAPGAVLPPPEQAPPPRPAPPAFPDKPIQVRIHKAARSWKPVSTRFGGDVKEARTSATYTIKSVRLKGKSALRGESSKARAAARVYRAGEDLLIIVAVHPAKLARLRKHLEVRLKIVEGYLEGAEVAAVTIKEPGSAVEQGLYDSVSLRRRGVAFLEEFPGKASLTLSAVNPRPGKRTWNAGAVRMAEFADPRLGDVNFSFAARGLEAGDASLLPKPRPPKKKAPKKKPRQKAGKTR
jgi:hypothetical protein